MTINKVILIGRIARAPEVKETKSGGAIASVSLATSKKAKDGTEVTEWHNVVFFNRSAEIAAQYLDKGSQIYVEGSLRYREYEKDGVSRKVAEIVCDQLKMLGGRSDRQQSAPAQTHAQPQTQAPARKRIDILSEATAAVQAEDFPF